MSTVTSTPATIKGWYDLTEDDGTFLEALSRLDGRTLADMLRTEAAMPPRGNLRTKAEFDVLNRKRKPQPNLDTLRSRKPIERTLQYMWMHRGYFVERYERIVWRELPTCCSGETAYGWADLLAFDTHRAQPIIVELKQANASDALSRTVLEALWHWVFNTQHLAKLHASLPELGPVTALRPKIAIAAPQAYFDHIRSQKRTLPKPEYDVALSWIEHLRDEQVVSIEVYAVDDDWQTSGPDFGVMRRH